LWLPFFSNLVFVTNLCLSCLTEFRSQLMSRSISDEVASNIVQTSAIDQKLALTVGEGLTLPEADAGDPEQVSHVLDSSTRRRRAALKLIRRSGAVFLAITWDMAMQFTLWRIYQPDSTCKDPTGRTSTCPPTSNQSLIQFGYAFFITLLCASGVAYTHKKMHQPDARRSLKVHLQFIKLALALIPAWAWTSAVQQVSITYGGIGASFAFSIVVTVISLLVIYFCAVATNHEKLKQNPFFTADLEMLAIALGLATANSWQASINLAISYNSTLAGLSSSQFAWATLLTVVVAYTNAKVNLFAEGSVVRQYMLFLFFEVTTSIVGLAWNQVIFATLVNADIAVDASIPSYLAWAIFITLVCWFIVYRLKYSPQDLDTTSFSRQSVYLFTNSFSVMVGQAWSHVSSSLFVLITSSVSLIIVYFSYAICVTLAFFLLIYCLSKLPFRRRFSFSGALSDDEAMFSPNQGFQLRTLRATTVKNTDGAQAPGHTVPMSEVAGGASSSSTSSSAAAAPEQAQLKLVFDAPAVNPASDGAPISTRDLRLEERPDDPKGRAASNSYRSLDDEH